MINRNAIIDAWRTLSGMSRLAIGLAVAAIVVLLWVSPPVIAALFASSLNSETQATNSGEKDALAYDEAVRQDVEFISQRSPFFTPAPPPAKPVERPVIQTNSGPAPIPRTYGGPKLIGLVGSEGALFDKPVLGDKQYIAVGQQGGQVEIVSIDHPWQAHVRWAGGEFDLNLFDRLESSPGAGFGATTPIGQPTPNIFGAPPARPGTAAATAGDLDFGAAAGDSTEVDDN